MNIIILCISVFSVISFLIIAFLRMYAAKNQVKQYGMRKEITDPITYWISSIAAIAILALKGIQFYNTKSLTTNINAGDIILKTGGKYESNYRLA